MAQVEYNERIFHVVPSKGKVIEIYDKKGEVLGGYYEKGACHGNFTELGLENSLSLLEVQEILNKFGSR